MTKRPHSKVDNESNKLGAGEFATILNGDDGRQILAALKSFRRTIRRERRLALNENDEDDDSDDESDEEGETTDQQPNKVSKEEWMKDSKDYNVPFVGTSVAKGDTGRVVIGEWPTGFLKAYLEKSPLAVELTSADLIPPTGHVHKRLLRQKQGKLSYAIHKAYRLALVELVSAAVPISTLRRKYNGDDDEEEEDSNVQQNNDPPKFLSVFLKDCFPGIVQLLNEETASGHGKASGVGQLAVPALNILTQLSLSSVATARIVARALDATVRGGVLKVLLREPRKSKLSSAADNDADDDDDDEMVDQLEVPYNTRSSCLQLAIALLEMKDQSIAAYISTVGSRDRKNNPGILYLALRYGLLDSMFQEQAEETTDSQEGYLASVSDVLEATSRHLVDQEGLLTRRHLADLLGADALQNLHQIATCAPHLESFEAVLNGSDEHSGDDEQPAVKEVGIDARRLLLPLLADPVKSPFLARISGKEDDKLSSIYTSFIVKTLNNLLKAGASRERQNFVIHCLTQSPLLFPSFFRGLQTPDIKSTFTFISRMSFIARAMKEGPPPSRCTIAAADNHRDVERMVLVVLPQNLNKNILSRAIQSSNPLVVMETAKTIMVALSRFQSLLSSVDDGDQQDKLTLAFASRLPDVQALVVARSKVDPCKTPTKANAVMNGMLCRLLTVLAGTLPGTICAAKFDWIKLLPDDIMCFSRTPPVAQLQLLDTLDTIVKCKQSNSKENDVKPTSKSCLVLMEVVMAATSQETYECALSIVTAMLLQLVGSPKQDNERSYCFEYEISLWIGGMKKSCLKEFRVLLEQVSNNALRHRLSAIKSWKAASLQTSVPTFSFSLLLSVGLAKFEAHSDEFSELVCQVASRCVLFHSNPVPLATRIHDTVGDTDSKGNNMLASLQLYSKQLLEFCKEPFNVESGVVASKGAAKLYGCLKGNATEPDQEATISDATLDMRYYLQCLALIGRSSQNKLLSTEYSKLVQDSIPRFIQGNNFQAVTVLLNHPAVAQGHLLRSGQALLQLISLSNPESDSASASVSDTTQLDQLTLNIASASDAKLSDETMFTLLKVWLSNGFVPLPRYSAIGESLTRLLTTSTESRQHQVLQVLTLHWLRNGTALPLKVAWDAWVGYTSRLEGKDRGKEPIEYEIVQAMEDAMTSIQGKEEALLFMKAKQLGPQIFIRRCMQSLFMCGKMNLNAKVGSSLLSKAMHAGCHDIADSLVNMKEAQALTRYQMQPQEYRDLQTSGRLDMELAQAKAELSRKQHKDSTAKVDIDETRSKNNQNVKEVVQLLCDLPMTLKTAFKTERDESISTSKTMLGKLLHRLENVDAYPTNSKGCDMDSVVKSCLKFGVSNSHQQLAVLSALCLKLLGALLSRAWHPTTPGGAKSMMLDPHRIFSMIVSHSKFSDAIKPVDGIGGREWRATCEELVELLVSCVSLSTDAIAIEEQSLKVLLQAYNGGTTKTDKGLRRLFYLVAPHISEEIMPSMDEIGSLALCSDASTIESGWGFLDNSLDSRRLRETLSQFPRFAYLTAKPLEFETWAEERETHTALATQADDDEISTSDSSSASGDDEMSVDVDDEHPVQSIEESSVRRDDWRGRGPDLRYDPSFVVPQIWAALEDMVTEGNVEPSADFARRAQGLCDQGGLALCLASLCSKCPSVRKLAFSSLCLFMRAVDSEAAKDLTTWRERPQLKMILNSVQRGFVMRKAMLASKGLGSEIPVLSSLSAVFLAKASIVLLKPGDTMYGAINKYFLKLDKSHGAYHDMTRLPAFIPFFCSSSEENSERERLWSIHCLRDSFLEGYSIVASCHAPALLLTALGRNRLDDVERQAILQALVRLLQFGDKAAVRHLLDRVGLISWLRVFLFEHTALSEDTKRSVLDLVSVAVQKGVKYAREGHKQQLALELCNLLEPLSSMDAPTFCVVVEGLVKLGYDEPLSPAGVTMASSLTLLLQHSSTSARMLEAICTAPVSLGKKEDTTLYCESVLRQLLDLPTAKVSVVLRRVCCLVPNCHTKLQVLHLVLDAHARGMQSGGEEYCQCLKTILESDDVVDNEDDWVAVAKTIVEIES